MTGNKVSLPVRAAAGVRGPTQRSPRPVAARRAGARGRGALPQVGLEACFQFWGAIAWALYGEWVLLRADE